MMMAAPGGHGVSRRHASPKLTSRRAGAGKTKTALRALAAAEDTSPDTDLIADCASWQDAIRAMEAEQEDDGPANAALSDLSDRISATKATTLAGMIAKARVAKFEAILPDGREDPTHCYAADLAWDLLNDFLRLIEGGRR